jgi:hypothetical protein
MTCVASLSLLSEAVQTTYQMHECCFLKSLAIDFCMTSKWRVAVNEIAILKRVSSVCEAEILFARCVTYAQIRFHSVRYQDAS